MLGLGGGELCYGAAFVDGAGAVGAGVDGFLEDLHVPSVEEVAVEAVACGVAVGEDKGVLGAVPLVGEGVGVVEDFVEDGDHVDWEVGWARAVVVVLGCWVAHVGFVVGRVEIFAVPAAGEEDLGAEATRAVVVGDAVCLGLVGAEAGEGDALSWEVIAVAAFEGISSKHAESFGVCGELLGRSAWALEIVDSHAASAILWVTDYWDWFEGAILHSDI